MIQTNLSQVGPREGTGGDGAEAKTSAPSNSKTHQVNETSGMQGLIEMVVVPLASFVEHGAIPRRSEKGGNKALHVPVSQLKAQDRVLFFSQRWVQTIIVGTS